MFDGFWSGVIGAILSRKLASPPTPMRYLLVFLAGAAGAELFLLVSIGASIGFGEAWHLLVSKFLSPECLGCMVAGGIISTSTFWFRR